MATIAPTYTKDSPLIVTIHGTASIPHKAERAVLNVVVSASGENKQWATNEVTTTAKHIRKLLEDWSPDSDTPEAKEAAIIAHWNMTRLTSTSHRPVDKEGYDDEKAGPIFDISLSFNIRVRKFAALGGLAAKLSGMTHVSLNNIEWVLTAETQKSHESQLRRLATSNALEQARDYGEPLGITKFRPVSIEPQGGVRTRSQATAMTTQHGRAQTTQFARKAGKTRGGSAVPQTAAAEGGEESGDAAMVGDDLESDLAFFPEEIYMVLSAYVKFIGE